MQILAYIRAYIHTYQWARLHKRPHNLRNTETSNLAGFDYMNFTLRVLDFFFN